MTQRILSRAAAATLLALAGLGASAQTAEVLTPPAALVIQGIPAIPKTLAARVAAYTEFRGHGFADWHPTKAEMLVAHRPEGANVTQLFRLESASGKLIPFTSGAEPVGAGHYEPRKGEYVVFERASGGNEVGQLYRQAVAGGEPVQLTPSHERHSAMGWRKKAGELIYAAVPLDRTAAGGSRAQIQTTFWAIDPLQPQQRRQVAVLEGGGWFGGAISEDDRWMAVINYKSANESHIHLLDLTTGEMKQLLPRPGATEPKATHAPAGFSKDGQYLFFTSDRSSEFKEAMRLRLKDGHIDRISASIPWDISGGSLSADGRTLVLQANVDGRDEMHFYDARTLKALPLPKALQDAKLGAIGSTRHHPKLPLLAFSVNGAKAPSQVFALDAKGAMQTWTQPFVPAGIDTSGFREQEVVRWKSFDGLDISGLLSRPPAKFAGKRPVIVSIHGGPEGQSTVGFLGRTQYLIQELGYAFIQPNVRGSTGFGKRFLALDNGFLREDSVKDIGALLDWIKTQPDLDASRVLVMGGSYGGYMSLAVSTHYADRIAGAIDVVGISHFVTFLNNTESYRRDLRRVEYGDEREPKMKEFLERISPLTNAGKIKKPLFVVQGKNDPRVPYTEAEQIVAKVRELGTPVWYLRAENEGHGFAKKENADYQFLSGILFMQDLFK